MRLSTRRKQFYVTGFRPKKPMLHYSKEDKEWICEGRIHKKYSMTTGGTVGSAYNAWLNSNV